MLSSYVEVAAAAAVVAAARADGTYDIHYDDGDHEDDVDASFIRASRLPDPPRYPTPDAAPPAAGGPRKTQILGVTSGGQIGADDIRPPLNQTGFDKATPAQTGVGQTVNHRGQRSQWPPARCFFILFARHRR